MNFCKFKMSSRAKVLFDYTPTDPSELQLTVIIVLYSSFFFLSFSSKKIDQAGEIIKVVEVDPLGGWWRGQSEGSEFVGWFPSNFCKLLEEGGASKPAEERPTSPPVVSTASDASQLKEGPLKL